MISRLSRIPFQLLRHLYCTLSDWHLQYNAVPATRLPIEPKYIAISDLGWRKKVFVVPQHYAAAASKDRPVDERLKHLSAHVFISINHQSGITHGC